MRMLKIPIDWEIPNPLGFHFWENGNMCLWFYAIALRIILADQMSLGLPFNSHFFYACLQRGWIESQYFGGTFFPAYFPVCFF